MPITVGGLIAYRPGPVGPYGEVFGARLMLRGGLLLSHIAFRLRAQRRRRARQLGAAQGSRRTRWVSRGSPAPSPRASGWERRVTTTTRPRRFPLSLTSWAAQIWDDGRERRFSVGMRGSARLASATVEHGAAGPPGEWLADGRHLAVLLTGVQDVSPPREQANGYGT